MEEDDNNWETDESDQEDLTPTSPTAEDGPVTLKKESSIVDEVYEKLRAKERADEPESEVDPAAELIRKARFKHNLQFLHKQVLKKLKEEGRVRPEQPKNARRAKQMIFAFWKKVVAFASLIALLYQFEFTKPYAMLVTNLLGLGGYPVAKSEWKWLDGPKLGAQIFRDEDIAYVEGGTLYLIILGHVFDVSKGVNSYGPNSTYHCFIGKDASRSFVSGDFTPDGLSDDVEGLSADGYIGLRKWLEFNFEGFPFKGYHLGRYFNKDGMETQYMANLKYWILEAENVKLAELETKKAFPPCNVERKASTGTKYWCSKKSGGVERGWEGIPIQFAEDKKSVRCACVKETKVKDPRLRSYENCTKDKKSCFLPPS